MSEATAAAAQAKPKVKPDFDDDAIPTLEEVLGHSGRAGMQYVYAKAKSLARLKEEGWRLSPSGETVEINEETYLVMFRGEPVGVGGEGAELFLDTSA